MLVKFKKHVVHVNYVPLRWAQIILAAGAANDKVGEAMTACYKEVRGLGCVWLPDSLTVARIDAKGARMNVHVAKPGGHAVLRPYPLTNLDQTVTEDVRLTACVKTYLAGSNDYAAAISAASELKAREFTTAGNARSLYESGAPYEAPAALVDALAACPETLMYMCGFRKGGSMSASLTAAQEAFGSLNEKLVKEGVDFDIVSNNAADAIARSMQLGAHASPAFREACDALFEGHSVAEAIAVGIAAEQGSVYVYNGEELRLSGKLQKTEKELLRAVPKALELVGRKYFSSRPSVAARMLAGINSFDPRYVYLVTDDAY